MNFLIALRSTRYFVYTTFCISFLIKRNIHFVYSLEFAYLPYIIPFSCYGNFVHLQNPLKKYLKVRPFGLHFNTFITKESK